MFTRFNDDDARIQKKMEVLSHTGRYQIGVPGNGMDLAFCEDPHLRLQKWGANLGTNATNVESDLLGLSRKYCRDHIAQNDFHTHRADSQKAAVYTTDNPFVCESRSALPAWTFRGIQIHRWEHPFVNPQAFTEREFTHNIQTRILEKDHFQRSA